MSRIRIGVVGCTRGRHLADGFNLAKDRAELVWVADLNESLAQTTAAKLGCSYTTDWESRLDEVDAVSIATPHHLHAPQAIKAMQSNKHVLIEKPMANSVEECLSMADVAKAHDVRLMTAYQLRYWPAVRWVQHALNDQRFGSLLNIACWTHVKTAPRGPGRQTALHLTGGGALFNQGCHYIDLMIGYLGAPEAVAYIGSSLGTEWMEGEGSAQAIMRFPGGALGHYEISWGCSVSKLSGQMHLYFPDALLILHIAGRVDLVTKQGTQVLFQARDIDGKWQAGENTVDEVQHFLDCIERHEEPLTGPAESMKSLQTIWRMYAETPGSLVHGIQHKSEVAQ